MFRQTLLLSAALLLAGVAPLRADSVRLANGDTIHGKVVSIDEKNVIVESETFGKITLPREKVAGIALGNGRESGGPTVERPADVKPADVKIDPKDSPLDLVKKLIPSGFDAERVKEMARGAKPAANPEDVVRELRDAGGVDPALRRELSLGIPGFTSPAVQGYFDKQVNGLMSGEISLGDIRNDAVKVRDELEALKKDLGPSGAALDGYLGILNGFIRETETVPAKKSNPAKPTDVIPPPKPIP